MERIIQQFDIQGQWLLAQIINFIILLVILNYVLYKPLLKVLEQRRKTIADSLKNAEKIEKKLADTEEESEKRLVNAAREAQKLLDDAAKSASQVVSEAHLKAQTDINEMMEKAQQSISQERVKMQQELREELSELVVVALEKITGRILNKTDQKKLIEQTVKEL